MTARESGFEGNALTVDDLSIVIDVLRANPSLEATAYAIALLEQHVEYPIDKQSDLLVLFRERYELPIGEDRTVDLHQVKEYLPVESFPIYDREELISRVLMAFERERMDALRRIPIRRSREMEVDYDADVYEQTGHSRCRPLD